MQGVDNLGEDVARPLIAILIHQKEPQAPLPHRKLRNGRRFVAVASGQKEPMEYSSQRKDCILMGMGLLVGKREMEKILT